jgi:uncharacterized lipoprotein
MRTFPRSTTAFAKPAAALLAITLLSGCHWFRSDNVFEGPEASRPLEVPPDLDLPRTDGAMVPPGEGTTSVTRSSMASAPAAASGFTVAGDRDGTFARVGEVLAATEGVAIASRAQVLGAYDVSYLGSNFLVRVSAVEGGAYVSAVDPRGVPAGGEAPSKLLAILKAALGG